MVDLAPRYRLPLLALGFLSLLLGLAAGVARLGWSLPLPRPGLIAVHGPLMAAGFFGTLIGLERAVAIGRRWAYLGPVCSGLGGLALITGAPVWLGALLFVAGGALFVAASWAVWQRQRALFTLTLLLGAVSWLVGNLLWLGGRPLPEVLPWWLGFLVLTIAGERLELSRLLTPPPAAERLFLGVVVALLLSQALTVPLPAVGQTLAPVALLVLALWLLRYDLARRTVRSRGLPRFVAVCLLSGYGWLIVAALLGLAAGGLFVPGPVYDATLHALLLGFVFSMVFGHAPIIFPAVTRFTVPYHPLFYLPLVLLHLTLALRVSGDLAGVAEWRALGGLGNGLTLVVFLLNTVAAVVRGRLEAAAKNPLKAR